jgi:hypothetical protein
MSLETISDPTIVKIKKKKNFGESQIKMVNLRLIYVSSKDSEGIVTVCLSASDKVYQLLAQGRWFSPGTSASSTIKTGRHDIAEILLKVALNTKIQIL